MSELNLKSKTMLSTKDMSAGSGRTKPVLGPGNHVIRINSITFDKTPYDSEAYNIMLHVETKPVGGDFEGFYKDMADQSKGRYEGQVGRVRYSPYPFKDTTLPSGREIERDQEVLKSMIFLSEQLGKRDALDSIEDDNMTYIIPRFEAYKYDKENPGVEIKILKNVGKKSQQRANSRRKNSNTKT